MARPDQLRRDEATTTILTFLAMVAYIAEHEPSGPEAMAHLEISKPTLKRRLALARAVGVRIVSVRTGLRRHYVVEAFGPLSRDGLLGMRAPARAAMLRPTPAT